MQLPSALVSGPRAYIDKGKRRGRGQPRLSQLPFLAESQESRLGGCPELTSTGASVLIWMYSGSPSNGCAARHARSGCWLGQWVVPPGTSKPEDSTQLIRQEMVGKTNSNHLRSAHLDGRSRRVVDLSVLR